MIYLDYNATTPVDPRVVDAMMPVLRTEFANSHSKHAPGQRAAALVEVSREQVADLAGTSRRNVVFTSGATEALNLAIQGVMVGAGPDRRRILVGATEHKAVLAAADAAAAAAGGKADLIRVHPDGTLDLDHLNWLLAADVALVAVMAANNETGVINDVRLVAELAHRVGSPLLCDLTQAIGKIGVQVDEWEIDLAACSAHKLYGPKGVGALTVTPSMRRRLPPLILGGSQERGLRPGTVNTPGIAGFGAAAELAVADLGADALREQALVQTLHELLAERVEVQVNGAGAQRLPNTVNLRFPGAPAEAVLSCLPDVAVSSGAACSADAADPSHVLLAMGLSPEAALESLRFSTGRPTTELQVRTAAELVATAVGHVLSLVPGAQQGTGTAA